VFTHSNFLAQTFNSLNSGFSEENGDLFSAAMLDHPISYLGGDTPWRYPLACVGGRHLHKWRLRALLVRVATLDDPTGMWAVICPAWRLNQYFGDLCGFAR